MDSKLSVEAGSAFSERRTQAWLFVLPWELKEPGGVSQVVQNLLDSTQSVLGQRSLLLVNTWNMREPIFLEVDGRLTVHARVQSPISERRPLRHLLSFLLWLPASLWHLRRLVLTQGVGRINVHYPGLNALTWLLVRAIVRPAPQVVLSFHGTDLRDARNSRGLQRKLWSLLLRGADEVTACSEPLRTSLVEAFGTAVRQARTVVNGVDPALVRTLSQAVPDLALPPRFVLSLATIERKKGLDTLIKAFACLSVSDSTLCLVIAGRLAERTYFEEIKTQAAAQGCAERIIFLVGLPHGQAMAVLARASALVLASRQEPFGIVVLEAGILGVPVIATSACGVVGLLQDEQEVIVVPPDDAQAMSEALIRLLSQRKLADRLISALRQRVLADFTWDRVISQYVSQAKEYHE